MIDHLDKLAKAGVTSFKIEGRAKSAYYVAVVTNAYRAAVDILKHNLDNYNLPAWIHDEVFKVSHRKYCTGFYFGHPKDCQYYETSGYVRDYDVVAVVDDCREGSVYCTQRNRFFAGDELEVLAPNREPVKIKADIIYNELGESVPAANKATMRFSLPIDMQFESGSVIRKEVK